MDGLSAAASVIAVIQISERIATLCSQYFTAVNNAKPDIEHLQGELSRLKTVLEGAQQILKGPNGARLQTSQRLRDDLDGCSSQLNELRKRLEEKLNVGKRGKVMSRLGFRALKWPFEKEQVDDIIRNLKGYRDTLSAALSIDTIAEVLDISQKFVLSKLPIAIEAAFNSHAEEYNARCHPNTRTELLDQICKWVDDPCGECIFWLRGMAGTGKSTISRTAAKSFAKKGQLGASFFFKRGERDRGHAGLLFTTIASQLISNEPRMAPFLQEAIDTDPAISGKALKEQFDKLVLHPLGKLTGDLDKPKTIVMVIDALDECEERDVKVVIYLLSLTKTLTSVRLRVFVTSRPELPIRLGFSNIKGKYQGIALHEIPEPVIEHDIAEFLKDELARIRDEYNKLVGQGRQLPLNWPDQATVDILVDMAVPLFIFAATVCRFINDRRSGIPEQQLKKILEYQTKSQKSKLDATYLPVLNQLLAVPEGEEGLTDSEKQELVDGFQQVVGSIVLLAEPLSTCSLAHLLGIDKIDVDSKLDLLHSVLSIPSYADAPVRLLHLSFRDFLVDSNKRHTNPFWVDGIECHKRIADRCLQLLDSKDLGRDRDYLRRDICNLQMPGKARIEIDSITIQESLPPHIQYACLHWVYHVEQSKDHVRDDGLVHLFLKRHFLHWLEALSLMGKISESIAMIGTLHSLLAKVSSKSQLFRLVQDAHRFILSTRYVIENTPLQAYSSALLFSPVHSLTRELFQDEEPDWITTKPAMEADWGACIQTLYGHRDWVNSVAFSHDGTQVVSGSDDETVKIWDAGSGACIQTLKGHSDGVNSVAFSHDGTQVVSGSDDETVKIWDASSGACIRTLEGHSDGVNSVAFSHDGTQVVSGSDDQTVKIWDASSSACIQTLKAHSSGVDSVAFSHGGTQVVSGSDGKTVKIWDASSGACIQMLKGHRDWVNSVAFSHDGTQVVSGSDDETVKIWDASSGACIQTLKGHSDWVRSVAFSNDSAQVVLGSGDQTVKIWDASSGACIRTLKGHGGEVNSVAFSHNGTQVVSGSGDLTVKIWDASSGACIQTLKGHSSEVDSVAFSHDGTQVVSRSDGETVKIWDASSGACTQMLKGHSNGVSSVAFSHDGTQVVSGSDDRIVKIWDAGSGAYIQTLKGHSDWVRSVAFSYDSTQVVSGSDDETVKIWDASSGACIQTLKGHSDWVRSVAFSNDSAQVVSGSGDQTVKIWDASSGACIQTLKGHSDWVRSVAFSYDSTQVVSGSGDQTVKIWDASSGACIRTLEGHSDGITSVAFSHDGTQVVSGSDDQTVKIWDASSGACIKTLNIDQRVNNIAFDTTSSYLLTDMGTISWDISSDSNTALAATTLEEPRYHSYGLNADEAWITWNGNNVLWLPSEYRPSCSAVVSNTIVIGCSSGRVLIINFSFNKYPLNCS